MYHLMTHVDMNQGVYYPMGGGLAAVLSKQVPGMTATATITVAEEAGVLMVPNAALRWAPPKATGGGAGASGLAGLILPTAAMRGASQGVGSGRSVWVLKEGAPAEIAVETGASDGRSTMVSAETLAEGDAVITDRLTQAD